MAAYGQFCSFARAHEVLGGRWTLVVVRELLCGSQRFNDIRRGIPRISRTMLSDRLQSLVLAGVVERVRGADGPEYLLTKAGQELISVVSAFGTWGQRWMPRRPKEEDLDLEPLLVDLRRRVRHDALPRDPIVVRFEIKGSRPRFLLLKIGEVSLCAHNPGFPEPICVRGPLSALVGWWRGDVTFAQAQRQGLSLAGPYSLRRAFPGWFDKYLFAQVSPARRSRSRVVTNHANAHDR